jgi:hypothetical protein
MSMRQLGLVLGLSACGGGGDGGGGGCGGGNKLVYEDANNYTYTGALTLGEFPIKPQSDITIDWSGLTTDIRGRTLDPTSVEQPTIIGLDGTFDEVLPQAERNEIRQDDAPYIYFTENDGETSAQLSSFEITGILFDLGYLVPDPETTWFLSLINLPQGRTDILSTVRLVPTEGSDITTVTFANDSSSLDVAVDLHSAPPLQARAGKNYTFDWTGATQDVFGHEFSDQLNDEIIIAKHDTTDIAEVEANFLQLDSKASELYRIGVFDQSAVDLIEAIDVNTSTPFGGFTTDGTWVIGVICSSCSAPVPAILSVVEVN